VVKVVIDPLAPLHDHVGDSAVGADVLREDDARGDEPSRGLGVAVVPATLVPADRLREAVLVHRPQNAAEARVGGAPGRVLQVVTLAGESAVASVEAPVQALVLTLVRRAAREALQLRDLLHDRLQDALGRGR
jgi:hypothetical protein